MFKFIMTYFFTLFIGLTFAQSSDTFKISGTITSLNSNQPISNATVMFTRAKGVLSDSLGRFTIYNLTKGQRKISFSASGYDNKDTEINIVDKGLDNFKFLVYTS